MRKSFHLPLQAVRFGWSRDFEPAIVVPSGAEIAFDVGECSNGQVRPESSADVIRTIDFARVDPISGPVFVEGARPGDVLEVQILETKLAEYGWSANYPGEGLLPDDFPTPWLFIWDLTGVRAPFVRGASIPIEPMIGIVGCASAAPGLHPSIPPGRTGGNMDIKHVGLGTTVYLPVEVEGALFGIGDPHAAQGDGEVGGSGIEASMGITVRLTVRRDLSISFPEYEVHRPLERWSSAQAGYYVTTGIGPDIVANAQEAVRSMIRRLVSTRGFQPVEAYELCSVALDLKISEIVDHPNFVVSAFLPNDLFA